MPLPRRRQRRRGPGRGPRARRRRCWRASPRPRCWRRAPACARSPCSPRSSSAPSSCCSRSGTRRSSTSRASARSLALGGGAVAALVVCVPLAVLFARRPWVMTLCVGGRAAVPDPRRGGRRDRQPARAALPRDRRGRPGLGGPAPARGRAGAAAAAAAGDPPRRLDRALRAAVRLLVGPRQGDRADDLLLRPVRAALRGHARPQLVAAPAPRGAARAGRARRWSSWRSASWSTRRAACCSTRR